MNLTIKINFNEKSLKELKAAKGIIDQYINVQQQHESKKNIQIKTIIKNVAKYYNVELLDLESENRKETIVLARRVIYYLVKKEYKIKISLSGIGSYFNQDHSTVHYAINQLISQMKTYKKINSEINDIKSLLKKKLY